MLRRVLLLLSLICPALAVRAQNADFVQANVDNATPYVGQPVLYTWQWYRTDVDTENTENVRIEMPDFAGFGQKTLPQEPGQSQLVNGQQYQVITQQIVLYPLQAGEVTIAPLRIFAPETPFRAALLLETPPVALTVLPLPAGAPESFENAVGQFDAAAELSAATVAAGQPVTLTVTITGSGNIEQLLMPDLPLAEGWRIYPNPPRFVRDTPQVGRQIFTWTLIPLLAGTQTIPPVEMSFFNPLTSQYETRAAAPLLLDVQPGSFTPAPVVSPTPAPVVTASVRMLKPLPATLAEENPMPGVLFWLAWLIPPLITGLVWLSTSRRTVAQQPRISGGSRALQQAQAQLKAAASLAPAASFERVGAVVMAYLSAKSGKKIGRDTLPESLRLLPDAVQKRVLNVLEQADGGRYAPVTAADAADLVKLAQALLLQVDKQWKKS